MKQEKVELTEERIREIVREEVLEQIEREEEKRYEWLKKNLRHMD